MVLFYFFYSSKHESILRSLTVRNQLLLTLYCSNVQCGDAVGKEATSWPVWPCQVLMRPVESAVITTSRFSSLTIPVKGLCTGLHHRSSPWEKKQHQINYLPRVFIPAAIQLSTQEVGNSGRKSVSVAAGMKPAHTRGLKLQLIAVRISGLVYVKGLNAVRYPNSNAATFTSGFTLWHLKSKF